MCVCETIAKEEKKIEIYATKRRYGKFLTIVANVSNDMNPKDITKNLKQKLACGGTYKDGMIELQGNHCTKVRELLVEMGFANEQLVVKGVV